MGVEHKLRKKWGRGRKQIRVYKLQVTSESWKIDVDYGAKLFLEDRNLSLFLIVDIACNGSTRQ